MIHFTATYRATALCLVAIALTLAMFINHPAQSFDVFVILALVLLVTLGTFILERAALRKVAPIEAAWKARASYQHMVLSCAVEYAHALACHYTKREARSFLRAHIASKYHGLGKADRNMVMREAIEEAALIDLAPAPIKDVNARPIYA